MATMRDIRRRIRTVRNIQQITKALKMVAAARLQRAQSRAAAARPYSDEMLALMGQLASVAGSVEHPLLAVRAPEKVGVIMVTSDRGMAGSYNTSVIRQVLEFAGPNPERVKLITVGKKGRAFFAKRGYAIAAEFDMPSAQIGFAEAQAIGRTAREMFVNGEVDVVHLVYTRFYSAITQRVTSLQLLPLAASAEAQPEEYIFEPSAGELLSRLLPRYVDAEVYHAMLESLASEHGARMTAMSSATDNAGEMIDRLTLDLNRARQATITKELAEIVGGADALK
ncbi:MAG: ATP synthase F1 subunit gamma [Armatimonadota bacterium]